MGFMSPSEPPFEIEEWRQRPYRERLKPLAQDWAVNGIGVPQAVYPEGGLTRDGRMRDPKLGVLDYMLRGFDLRGERDLVFVPLGLNYDRVLEDRSLLLEKGATGRAKSLWITARFALHNLSLMIRSEWHRFGYACVNFGTPISMRRHGKLGRSTYWCAHCQPARTVNPR